MIRRLYVHNFRCLQNFTLSLEDRSSALLIGPNGSGKSTVRLALQLLQRIARGGSRVGTLLNTSDGPWGRTVETIVHFEIDAEIDGVVYSYKISFELPPDFKEFRIYSESLTIGGEDHFSRSFSEIALQVPKAATFRLDWHLAALPIIQERSVQDPLHIFKHWLSRMIILSPVPDLIDGGSSAETLEVDSQGTLFGSWFAGLVAHSPNSYLVIDKYLRELMPDFEAIENPLSGKNYRKLEVLFKGDSEPFSLPFEMLSTGEKCFFICAVVLASARAYGPLVCFWDEPDSHLAISEVGHFVLKLRSAFKSKGQFIATSHTEQAIRKFSNQDTFVLYRSSHRVPPTVRLLSEFSGQDDAISALVRGDLN